MNNNNPKYKTIFNIVRNELNQLDPLGVVANNKNLVDEYNLETQDILNYIDKCTNHIELSKIIAEIFTKSNNTNYTPDIFEECAKNILNNIQN